MIVGLGGLPEEDGDGSEVKVDKVVGLCEEEA
jgi:hypothetical protein